MRLAVEVAIDAALVDIEIQIVVNVAERDTQVPQREIRDFCIEIDRISRDASARLLDIRKFRGKTPAPRERADILGVNLRNPCLLRNAVGHCLGALVDQRRGGKRGGYVVSDRTQADTERAVSTAMEEPGVGHADDIDIDVALELRALDVIIVPDLVRIRQRIRRLAVVAVTKCLYLVLVVAPERTANAEEWFGCIKIDD